jgi:hypothetical protein
LFQSERWPGVLFGSICVGGLAGRRQSVDVPGFSRAHLWPA